MKLIEPFEVTEARLIDSNVPITETEWTAGTYNQGQERYVGKILYEVVASSTDDDPETGAQESPPTWIAVGTINRFSAFDGVVGRPSEVSSGSMTWEIQGVGLVNGVALFGLFGETATIRITRPSDSELVYERTWSLRTRGTPETWWEWFFDDFLPTRDIIATDMPTLINPIIEIEVDGDNGPAELGEAFIGSVQDVGVTLIDTTVEIEDFSRRERDQFGNFIITPRASTRLVRYAISVNRTRLGKVDQILRSRLAVPTVFIGSEKDPTTTLVGFPRNIQTVFNGSTAVEMLFEVEGMI